MVFIDFLKYKFIEIKRNIKALRNSNSNKYLNNNHPIKDQIKNFI